MIEFVDNPHSLVRQYTKFDAFTNDFYMSIDLRDNFVKCISKSIHQGLSIIEIIDTLTLVAAHFSNVSFLTG
ncbi:hypothetical protein GQR93_00995 [Lentilactobacillus hilgardii]|jgi:hypothetical protein|uniref:Uncharacterized protein n=1 Tax=Lentilactobacillus hilgardii TaxID=1588 RepID=A0A6P1E175_LENHI|nr:hypothetical protein HMPREF0496_0493 [Lentilactobacillus hilgardii ATCC 27305]MCT3392961.1 hypothetical protein [Lentilactobacillus hilgardii]QHB50897.1 hypothetical protein GQR93_00995 [Lentilactobacillus hilgardii]RRG08322.1 MAG: hypothetical protein DUD35_11715 [Lactobacillus sp.]